MDRLSELLTRGVANIIPGRVELQKRLESGDKLNVYLGIDPTATKIHLGHAVSLRKLQKFAELDHNVTFLIGDFTALVGDSSDKDSERPVLTSEEIEENFQTYKKQAEKIVDFSKVKVVHNSQWLKDLDFKKVLQLSLQFSANDFMSRELIRKRLDEGKRVGLHEVLYPLMQGYDSYFLDTDLQIGGTDQTFNMQAGRTLQKNWRQKESFVLTTEFLMGTDARKMSKSWRNAIWLDDKPKDMYAKVMAIEDDLVVQYFTLATDLSMQKVDEIKDELKSGVNPMEIKKHLADEIVSELHSKEDAKSAEEHFEKTVQHKEMPDEIPTLELTLHGTIVDVLLAATLAESRSEAKILVEQGGVTVDEKVITDPNEVIEATGEKVLRVGKRRFVKIKTT